MGVKLSEKGTATPVLTDHASGIDDPGGTPFVRNFTFASVRTLLEANFTENLVGGLTEITSIDGAADFFLVRDATDSSLKKVLGDNLPGGGGTPAGSSGQLQYNDGGAFGGANVWREGENTLALRNGVNAQTLEVYNTFTDAANYERAVMRYVSSVLEIGHTAAGTGNASRATHVWVGNGGIVDFSPVSGGGFSFFTIIAGGNPVINTRSSGTLGWAPSSDAGSNYDAGFQRHAAGVVKVVGNGGIAGAFQTGGYTVAGVPSASTAGAGTIIYVSNETGGATLAYSDGTDWRRVADRAVIAA